MRCVLWGPSFSPGILLTSYFVRVLLTVTVPGRKKRTVNKYRKFIDKGEYNRVSSLVSKRPIGHLIPRLLLTSLSVFYH